MATKSRKKTKKKKTENLILDEIIIIFLFGFSVFLLISCFGYGGKFGGFISGFIFGMFGIASYVFPIILFIGITFLISNKSNKIAKVKFIAGIFLFLAICAFAQMITVTFNPETKISEYYSLAKTMHSYGGLTGGIITCLFYPFFGKIGTYIIILLVTIVCLILISERSFLKGIENGSRKFYDSARNDAKKIRDNRSKRKNEQNNSTEKDLDFFNKRRKKSGVTMDTRIDKNEQKNTDKMHELTSSDNIIISNNNDNDYSKDKDFIPANANSIEYIDKSDDLSINNQKLLDTQELSPEEIFEDSPIQNKNNSEEFLYKKTNEENSNYNSKPALKDVHANEASVNEQNKIGSFVPKPIEEDKQVYEFPPITLLKKGDINAKGDSDSHLKEMAAKLQNTLNNFGVAVRITNVNCGPTVTRYEIQPEQGVKVSKIVNLADDIKLNLAAPDIRIEAPIPGKAAIGIEVPNKTNVAVMLRDLLENNNFKSHKSKLAFAAGKDISGQIVVTDIAKMPHLLIAGATGSGKSVCINTIIMSILYKAKPDEVKFIMIDPKVVELSVYNGIPHLMIPVVTEPKKAAGALQWGVNEMLDRYQKFADLSVRDLEHYNSKISEAKKANPDSELELLPQILIIVDELADLMMASPGEVEDSICRLAQLARAAGIHLIIATQRPSVNVITGLIKANMPSRMAFAVSSGVDSRTILDMNGAEKLLGKGDMLFYPQGMPKPLRVQGSFVSESEVSAVVKFLSSKNKKVVYSSEIEERINNARNQADSAKESTDYDTYFIDAGKFIIDKDKASIGMLQRVFKIGFNRAARIMDQLSEVGVVGEEEGTKPRKILMTMEEFEQFIEESY